MGVGFSFGIGPLRFYIPLIRGNRRPGRRKTVWTHGSCTIRHRTEGAANRCKLGCQFVVPPVVKVASFEAKVGAMSSTMSTTRDWSAFDHHDVKAMVRTAAELVVTTQFVTTSLLQRKMRIGIKDATEVVDLLEYLEIIGPKEPFTLRTVLISSAAAQQIVDLIDQHVDVGRQGQTPI